MSMQICACKCVHSRWVMCQTKVQLFWLLSPVLQALTIACYICKSDEWVCPFHSSLCVCVTVCMCVCEREKERESIHVCSSIFKVIVSLERGQCAGQSFLLPHSPPNHWPKRERGRSAHFYLQCRKIVITFFSHLCSKFYLELWLGKKRISNE